MLGLRPPARRRRALTAGVTGTTLVAAALVGGFAAATPAAAATEVAPFAIGSLSGQEWTVPAGVHAITVDVAGSAGGGGGSVNFPGTDWSITSDGAGGAGGRLLARVPVEPGQKLVFYTSTMGGPTGSKSNPGSGGAGWLRGGNGNTGSLEGHAGGGGGGASAVRIRTAAGDHELVVGGGGGGGGGLGGAFVDYRGGVGGASGQGGENGTGAGHGNGGGFAGNGGNGTGGGNAGKSSSGGGGGGGGAGINAGFGGGGGKAGGGGGGGGAGGQSWIDTGAGVQLLQDQRYWGGNGFVQLSYTVEQGTSLSAVSTQSRSVYGTPATITATVANTEGGAVPTGTVTASEGGTDIATALVAADGTASFPGLVTAVGSHALEFAYDPGDAPFAPATGTLTQIVDPAPTHFADLAGAAPAQVGGPLTITGRVLVGPAPQTEPETGTPTAAANDARAADPAAPTGSVTVSTGGGVLGTAPIAADGSFEFHPAWAAGTSEFTIDYAGDADYSAAPQGTLLIDAAKGRTTTALGLDFGSVQVGATATATVSTGVLTPAVIEPGGSVQLTLDGAPYGAGIPVGDADPATVELKNLAVGTHVLRASYAGDASFEGSSSAEVKIVVTAAPPVPQVPKPTPAPLVAGGPAVLTRTGIDSASAPAAALGVLAIICGAAAVTAAAVRRRGATAPRR